VPGSSASGVDGLSLPLVSDDFVVWRGDNENAIHAYGLKNGSGFSVVSGGDLLLQLCGMIHLSISIETKIRYIVTI